MHEMQTPSECWAKCGWKSRRTTSHLRLVATCLLVVWLAAPLAAANTLTPGEIAAGWILLFDGESLFGWEAANKADWHVADGAIRVGQGEVGLLHTTSRFADYQLSLEFRAAAGANSGVFLRTLPVPTDVLADCYELNIAPADNPFPTASFVGRKKVSSYPLTERETDWHRFDVRAEGSHFEIRLDGELVLSYEDPSPIATGHIGLQLNQGSVAFRNVKLRPLGTRPLLQPSRLDGWSTRLQRDSQFKISEKGVLHVRGGPGQLATAAQFANFVWQLDCYVNGDGLNSGLFFRCLPDEYLMGYESQIHNGFRDGDRRRPVDCGTGGIFRRQDARRIVANDREWFTKTIVADGPQFRVWVNGYPVSDWTDRREPHENPRRGRRDQAGALAIQGHDPTTDFYFRRMRIAETP